MADPFVQQTQFARGRAGVVPVIVLSRRQFQRTLGFWFAFATINGFVGGFAVNELGHLLGWWR